MKPGKRMINRLIATTFFLGTWGCVVGTRFELPEGLNDPNGMTTLEFGYVEIRDCNLIEAIEVISETTSETVNSVHREHPDSSLSVPGWVIDANCPNRTLSTKRSFEIQDATFPEIIHAIELEFEVTCRYLNGNIIVSSEDEK